MVPLSAARSPAPESTDVESSKALSNLNLQIIGASPHFWLPRGIPCLRSSSWVHQPIRINNLLKFHAKSSTKVADDRSIGSGYDSENFDDVDFGRSIARYRNVRIPVSFLQKAHRVFMKSS
jgi:hypothetical protein